MNWLVPDVRACKRWWTMHVMGVGFAFSAVKAGLIAASAGAGWFGALRREWAWLVVVMLFIAGAVVRILRQPDKRRKS